MIKFFKLILPLSLFLFFAGCASTQDEVVNALQTNSATLIVKNQKHLQKLLVKFKKKLDKRNPKAYNRENSEKILTLIKSMDANFLLKKDGKVLRNYKDYLDIAFSKDRVINRNDYLVLGIYYMIADSFNFKEKHKLAALQFNKIKMDKLFKNLQIIKWKIKVSRDKRGNYLFLTWQNNWQVELEKKMKKSSTISYKDIENLEYIKNGKESLLHHSNFSFEVILTQMIGDVAESLVTLGEEPRELAVKAIFFFF